METALAPQYRNTPEGREADAILRTCVHCGFCNATCPTYQLLGDELDGPRGRIYQIKQVLEGRAVSRLTQLHLDCCLTCTACETTCPSGVRYHHLLDIGRGIVEREVKRPLGERFKRRLLRAVLARPERFKLVLSVARALRPLLSASLQRRIPAVQAIGSRPPATHSRRMLVLEGCAQSVATPATNNALTRVLDRLGISLVSAPEAGCCGAVDYHLAAHQAGLAAARHNVDVWWPHVEAGVEAIIASASGCGAMLKDYGHLLRNDPDYADRARRISTLTRDASEVLDNEELERLQVDGRGRKVACHVPCSLQHTQKLPNTVPDILRRLGFELTPVADAHLCCGSAGTYSLLQEELSQQLLANKVDHLEAGSPELITTANIGCQLHLQSRAAVPVHHWIELLDPSV
ncbi:MAG: glycolate oxidase iron-sulfur subunit [Proteobacteria bacterium]|nr:MAG: glycolate oxidase iron-sulfur subunit [Pseudomonadota bacterium]